jgi:DNA-binding GntR family transcriptional regulator
VPGTDRGAARDDSDTTRTRLFSDRAYEAIRERIVTTELAPGRLLTEAELASQLGLGRMPVREALQRLVQDDLVVILPRKGSFVAPIRVEDLPKIFELRLALEGLASRLAAERMTAEELAWLEALIADARGLSDGSAEHVRVDRAFHRAIAAATRNEYLQRAVERTLNLALRLLYLSDSRMARVREIEHEYRAVLRALRRRDGAAAAAAMRGHIEEFRNKVRRTL